MCFAQKELAITVCQDGFKFIVVFDIEFRKFCSLKGRGRTVHGLILFMSRHKLSHKYVTTFEAETHDATNRCDTSP